MRLLLVITVIAVGGPHGTKPSPLPRVWVALPHHIQQTGRHGHVRLYLRPQDYEIRVLSLLPCQKASVRLSRHAREVRLRCSIP